jgi:syntaxin 18
MDRTDLFKSAIRTIRQKRRTLSQDGGTDPSLLLSSKVKNSPTPFNMLSKNTVDHVTQLRDFLLKHRRDYIDTSGYLSIDGMSMSDMERDMIDNGAQELIKESSDLINKLKNTTATPADEANSVGEQSKLHRMRVIDSLQNYLRDVCKLYSEQKAIRIRRMVDMKNVYVLCGDFGMFHCI